MSMSSEEFADAVVALGDELAPQVHQFLLELGDKHGAGLPADPAKISIFVSALTCVLGVELGQMAGCFKEQDAMRIVQALGMNFGSARAAFRAEAAAYEKQMGKPN